MLEILLSFFCPAFLVIPNDGNTTDDKKSAMMRRFDIVQDSDRRTKTKGRSHHDARIRASVLSVNVVAAFNEFDYNRHVYPHLTRRIRASSRR